MSSSTWANRKRAVQIDDFVEMQTFPMSLSYHTYVHRAVSLWHLAESNCMSSHVPDEVRAFSNVLLSSNTFHIWYVGLNQGSMTNLCSNSFRLILSSSMSPPTLGNRGLPKSSSGGSLAQSPAPWLSSSATSTTATISSQSRPSTTPSGPATSTA